MNVEITPREAFWFAFLLSIAWRAGADTWTGLKYLSEELLLRLRVGRLRRRPLEK